MKSLQFRPSSAITLPQIRLPSSMAFPVGAGVRAVLCPDPRSPWISLAVAVPVGAIHEPPQQAGIATLTAATALTGRHMKALEQQGVGLWSEVGWDFTVLSAQAPATLAMDSLRVLLRALTAPAFPRQEIEQQRQHLGDQHRRGESSPVERAENGLAAALYGEHRYGLPLAGVEESLKAMTAEALHRFHEQYFLRSGIVVVAVGALDAEEFRQRIAGLLPPLTAAVPAVDFSHFQPPSGVHGLNMATATHAEIRVGSIGVPLHHPDHVPLQVLNTVLGGGFAARLALKLREEMGIAYGASSRLEARRGPGPWIVRTAVAPEQAGAALVRIAEILERLRQEPVSASELTTAKGFLAGVMQSSLLSGEAIARRLLHLAAYDLLESYQQRYGAEIERVDRPALTALAERYLDPRGWTAVVVGPREALIQIEHWNAGIQFGAVTPGIYPLTKGGERHGEELRS